MYLALRLLSGSSGTSRDCSRDTALHVGKDFAVSPRCRQRDIPRGDPYPFGVGRFCSHLYARARRVLPATILRSCERTCSDFPHRFCNCLRQAESAQTPDTNLEGFYKKNRSETSQSLAALESSPNTCGSCVKPSSSVICPAPWRMTTREPSCEN